MNSEKSGPSDKIISAGLQQNSRVAIVGGGAAGAFFAIHLLSKSEKLHRKLVVTILRKPGYRFSGPEGVAPPGGACCADLIGPGLHRRLNEMGITIPSEMMCESYRHLWIHGMWKNFPFRVLPSRKINSYSRIFHPGEAPSVRSVDTLLLEKALALGARVIPAEVIDVAYDPEQHPRLTLALPTGEIFFLTTDFTLLAMGVKGASKGSHFSSGLFRSFGRLNPSFRPPGGRRSLVFQLKPGGRYLRRYVDKDLYVLWPGATALPLEYISLRPAGEHLAVTLAGACIDDPLWPGGAASIIEAFRSLPQIRSILPGLDAAKAPLVCFCTPVIPTAPARSPVAHGIALAGGGLGGRLFRDARHWALITTEILADTVLHKGVDAATLSREYGWLVRWLERENRYGRYLLKLICLAFQSPFWSRLFYQTFATEMKFKRAGNWPFGDFLWQTAVGGTGYYTLCRDLIRKRIAVSMAVGAFKTLRNLLTEWVFNINWQNTNRYPTVILKEKRESFKRKLEDSLDISLDPHPEMERMYAIKIRASARAIFDELGRFGDDHSRFLQLRFLDVKRVRGGSNQVGAVVTYTLRHAPLSMPVRLARSFPEKALLYEAGELFATKARLIFDISPTRDGNHRLVVYTAFNYRRGVGFGGRVLWALFSKFFPDFIHDVVWNHAICTIKHEAEKNNETGSCCHGSVNEDQGLVGQSSHDTC